jgi:hypothetical protein
MKSQSKECLTIRSALAVVSAHPSEEEHDVLRTGLRVGPAGSERLCSRKPWRSEQQWEDTLALRGKLVQESKTGEITTISEFFLQNHVSPSGLLTTRKSKNARIRLFPQAQPSAKLWYHESAKPWVK